MAWYRSSNSWKLSSSLFPTSSSLQTPLSSRASLTSERENGIFSNLDYSKSPEEFFGLDKKLFESSLQFENYPETKIETLEDFLKSKEPRSSTYLPDLATDLISESLSLGSAKTALDIAKDVISESKKLESKNTEEVVCKTAKLMTETGYKVFGGGAMVLGVPLFISEATAFPPLIAAAPVVAATLPQAYANVQHLAEFAGKKAESDCHLLFETYGSKNKNN